MATKQFTGKTMLGWCSGVQTPASHARCKFELIVSSGVHRDKLMICECECHTGRVTDYTNYPNGIVVLGAQPHTEGDDEDE